LRNGIEFGITVKLYNSPYTRASLAQNEGICKITELHRHAQTLPRYDPFLYKYTPSNHAYITQAPNRRNRDSKPRLRRGSLTRSEFAALLDTAGDDCSVPVPESSDEPVLEPEPEPEPDPDPDAESVLVGVASDPDLVLEVVRV
jgi:hypothetical protein